MDEAWLYVIGILPTLGLLYLFWVIMKSMIEGDRRERAALKEWEHDHERNQPGDCTGSK